MAEAVSLKRFAIALVALLAATEARARADEEPSCLDASDAARKALAARKLLDARAHLRACAAAQCDAAIRDVCDERLAEVTARLPTVIFEGKDPAGHDLTDVTLVLDGAVVSRGVLGAELTLDPGEHVARFEVPGAAAVERRYVLTERDKGRRERIVVGVAPSRAEPPREVVVAAPPSTSPLHTAGWLAIGAGAVGAGIGTAFGLVAIARNHDANCDASNVCDDPRLRSDAREAANVSTIAFVAGAVLAGAGIGLLWWSARPTTTKPRAAGAAWVF